MATKVSGLGWTTFGVGDAANSVQDIRNACTQLQFSTPRAMQDVTGIDKNAIERLGLLADYSITAQGVFDTAANGAHAVFSTVPSTSVNRTVNITTNSKNLNMASGVFFTDYSVTRTTAGELNWQAPGVGSAGVVPTWS